jgi:hypothetical protein
MTYEERNTIAHLISTIAVVSGLFFYLFRLAPLEGATDAEALIMLGRAFLAMVVAGIVVTILASILVNVGAGIAEGVKSGGTPEFATDERDHQFELRTMRAATYALGAGFVGAMALLAFGQPAFTVFLLLILAGAIADVFGSVFKLVLYRRGF